MMRRLYAVASAAFVVLTSVTPAGAAPKTLVVTAPAGAVARVTLSAFLPLTGGGSIDIVGTSSGDLAGAALVGRDDWGIRVSTVPTGCRFAGPCTEAPWGHTWATQESDDVRGLRPGTYDLVILGRPGAKVSLRLRNGLAARPLRFRGTARQHVTELRQLYPSTADQMPEAYFDQQLDGSARKNVTVLVGHLEAGRPKTLQFSSCLRLGTAPAVHVPRYGSGCLGNDANQFGGSAGSVSVGGQDCDTVRPPMCIPVTTAAFHLSIAFAQAFTAPPRVSLTADISALKSNVRASAITFTLP